jgi:hypothetical protein
MWGYFLLDVYCNFKRSMGYEELPDFQNDMEKIEYISKEFVRFYDNKTEEYDVTSYVLHEVAIWFHRSFEDHPGALDNILLELFVDHYNVEIPVENPFDDDNLVSDKYVDDCLCEEGYMAIVEKLKDSPFGALLDVSDCETLLDLNVKVMPFVHYWLVCEFFRGKLDDECPKHIQYETDDGDILIQGIEALKIGDMEVDVLDEVDAMMSEDKDAKNLKKVQSEVADLMLRIEDMALSEIMDKLTIPDEKPPKKARAAWE